MKTIIRGAIAILAACVLVGCAQPQTTSPTAPDKPARPSNLVVATVADLFGDDTPGIMEKQVTTVTITVDNGKVKGDWTCTGDTEAEQQDCDDRGVKLSQQGLTCQSISGGSHCTT